MTWKLKLLLLTLSSVYLITNGQKESTDDLTFTYKDRPEIDPPRTSTRRSHMSRPSRTSSIRPQTKLPVSMPAPHQKTSTSKSHGSILTPGSILLQVQQQANLPPFIYAQETLNQTHANMFAQWIDAKSAELYELSMNYSGFKILDETYKANLLREARPAWINFTEMIMNISKTISEVLNHKTLIVKNLTDLVEKAFDEYRNDPEKILESTKTLYYDAKSPKTFCDVQEATNARAAKLNQTIANSSATTTTTTTTTTKSVLDKGGSKQQQASSKKTEPSTDPNELEEKSSTTLKPEEPTNEIISNEPIENYYRNRRKKREVSFDEEEIFDIGLEKEGDKIEIEQMSCSSNRSINDCSFTNRNKRNKEAGVQKPGQQKGPKGRPQVSRRRPNMTTTRSTPTTPQTTTSSYYYDDLEERTDIEAYDDNFLEYELLLGKSPYWNISCMNRSFDENFKNFQKGVNRNHSVIHVPTNVYKQDIEINMTAYWTSSLDEQFRLNYDNDNELFWQYFCSSNGLFRRYPGAYWTIKQKEDFFDCRLQSWYLMAAASPKDVLILLDVSGSMTGSRLEIAKKLIEGILDTLSDNDFFNILTFSNKVNYLMKGNNETRYRNRFIQAGRTNKRVFIEKLKWFKNTSNIANFTRAFIKAFQLLLNSESLHRTESSNCNKAIMLLTDGTSENAESVFKKYNWENGRRVRVFTFLIGRDMIDSRQVEWMACANDGKYFHVATIADVNEHVHEYIPVLSQPMALLGHHETTWSNVFIGYMDKELKIAVARPAFKTKQSLIDKVDLIDKPEYYFKRKKTRKASKTTTIATTTTDASQYGNYDSGNPDYNYDDQYYEPDETYINENPATANPTVTDSESGQKPEGIDAEVKPSFEEEIIDDEEDEEELMKEEIRLRLADEVIKKQQVLLGVVGVDIPVLRLISKVSPKYQMGVGIYIIMLDNNGFIVFHPSIKKEITNSQSDYKGTSSSIDLDRFEVPINNDDDFENLEHEMIDQKTNNMTLLNWKREGLRVIKRRTEYVYTPVFGTPFSVAIASPSSFGRFYIDLPRDRESYYENMLRDLVHKRFDVNIQLYNCSYTYQKLVERLLPNKHFNDYCIKYLFSDKDQVLAIKSDLVLHNMYYSRYNFSIFKEHKNLVKASFYGTYSGMTFYLPVTFYKLKPGQTLFPMQAKPFTTSKTPPTTTSRTPRTSQILMQSVTIPEMTEPPSEMTINVELGSIAEPFFNTSTKPTPVDDFIPFVDINTNRSNDTDSETYTHSTNVFSSEDNKHTYSFEKQYYTRSIEFSDYLRTEFNLTEPIVNYFLNESREARKDSVGATIPLWLGTVPAAVAGVVYDAQYLQSLLFENYWMPDCDHITCKNLCSQKRGMNVTCYLVDEHGIVVLSTQERISKQVKEPVMGQPLYKVNPWLMKSLEFKGIYDLVIPGSNMPECNQLPQIYNSSSRLVYSILASILSVFKHIYTLICTLLCYSITSQPPVEAQLTNQQTADRIRNFNHEWRSKNSHCFYFGVYSFNLTRWKTLDARELHTWCNSSAHGNPGERHYLVGYMRFSNLIMLIVEDEFELYHCGNMSQLMKSRMDKPIVNKSNETTVVSQTNLNSNSNITDEFVSLYDDDDDDEWLNDSNRSNFSLFQQMPISNLSLDFTINRYRKKPDVCYNIFPNEKDYLPCHSQTATRILPVAIKSFSILFCMMFSCSIRLIV